MSKNQYVVTAACAVVNVDTRRERYVYRNGLVDGNDIPEFELQRLLRRGIIASTDNTEAVALAQRLDAEENGAA